MTEQLVFMVAGSGWTLFLLLVVWPPIASALSGRARDRAIDRRIAENNRLQPVNRQQRRADKSRARKARP